MLRFKITNYCNSNSLTNGTLYVPMLHKKIKWNMTFLPLKLTNICFSLQDPLSINKDSNGDVLVLNPADPSASATSTASTKIGKT